MGNFNKQVDAAITKYSYKPIKSEKYFCVPTSLKIVMDATMQNKFSIEKISSFFKINYPSEHQSIEKLGVIIKDNEINELFNSLSIPLKEDYIHISKIAEFEFYDTVKNAINDGCHILFGYSYGTLYKDPDLLQLGHVSIITEVANNSLTILNPGPGSFGYGKFDEFSIYSAIKVKNDGLWIISELV